MGNRTSRPRPASSVTSCDVLPAMVAPCTLTATFADAFWSAAQIDRRSGVGLIAGAQEPWQCSTRYQRTRHQQLCAAAAKLVGARDCNGHHAKCREIVGQFRECDGVPSIVGNNRAEEERCRTELRTHDVGAIASATAARFAKPLVAFRQLRRNRHKRAGEGHANTARFVQQPERIRSFVTRQATTRLRRSPTG